MFFQTKSDPTILFQNTIQIEADPNASKAVPQQKSYLPGRIKYNPKHRAVIDLS